MRGVMALKGTSKNVIPTKVGIHNPLQTLDSGFRRNDEWGVFRGALKFIESAQAPRAIGPYSQAVRAGNMLFCSGQIPIDPASGEVNLFGGDIGKQTELVLKNLAAVVQAAGGTMAGIVKTTVYLKNMSDFPAMNTAYAEAFGSHRPARATVAVAQLPKDVGVEIDAIAVVA